MKKYLKLALLAFFVTLALLAPTVGALAAPGPQPAPTETATETATATATTGADDELTVSDLTDALSGGDEDRATTVQILLMLTILSLAPSILIMMTGFTRIIIVLGFVRNAIGVQQMPPNQVLIGLALFLTFFVMKPILNDIYANAYQPYVNGQITQQQAMDRALVPMRDFMLRQTYEKDLDLFATMDNIEEVATPQDLPTSVVIPAFITSELKRAFQIGFFIFLPFIVIDMIVSSTLMSMGMMMLPPTTISLPFKILLFVLVDGWGLTIKTLLTSFQ